MCGEGRKPAAHARKTAGWVRVEKRITAHETLQGGLLVAKRGAGEALVASIIQGLPPGVELDERETALLDVAARQADDIARLEAEIAERGVRVPGSRAGHEILNPAISEVRQGRLALGKLLGAPGASRERL